MDQELIQGLQEEKKRLEEQMKSVLGRNGSIQPLLAYWKQLSDVLKEVAPTTPTTTAK